MPSSTLLFCLFLGLIGWRIYRRIRRNIGRQRLHPARAVMSIVILSLFSLALGVMSLSHPKILLALGGGLIAGVVLGFVGLRLTRFETTAEGHFYIPNTPIGVALSLLLVGRISYRLWILRDLANQPMGSTPPYPPPMQSALTYLIFGLIGGYYIVYQTGLFLHSRDKMKSANVPAAGLVSEAPAPPRP